jgi:hypothetical protein
MCLYRFNGPLVSFFSSVGLLLCLRRLRRLIGVSGSLTLAIILAAVGVELGLELVDDGAPGLVDLLSDGRKFGLEFVDTATRLGSETAYVSGRIREFTRPEDEQKEDPYEY